MYLGTMRKLRRISKEEVRPLIWMFAGVIFILISFLLAFRAIMASGSALAIIFLFALGIGFGFYGWKKFKEARY